MLLNRDGTRTMTQRTSTATTTPQQDLLLALFLVVLCVAMRLVPHVSNFSPVAAAALGLAPPPPAPTRPPRGRPPFDRR